VCNSGLYIYIYIYIYISNIHISAWRDIAQLVYDLFEIDSQIESIADVLLIGKLI